MESDFPTELGNTFRSMENAGNAYGMNQGDRGDWAAALEGVDIVEPGGRVRPRVPLLGRVRRQLRRPQQEDSRARSPSCCSARASTSRSSARASCATATRPAARATSTSSRCSRCRTSRRFDGMGVKKIITQCPHCFNTLKNDYPQLGGNYEVVHHSQLLDELVDDGRLSLAGRVARRARHVPRLVLPRPPQRRVPRAATVVGSLAGHRPRRDAPQRHEGHVLRRRRRAHVDGGEHRQEGQHRAQPGSDRDRRVAHRGRVPVLLRDVRRRREGRRQGRRGPASRTSPRCSGKRSRTAPTARRPSAGAFTPGI